MKPMVQFSRNFFGISLVKLLLWVALVVGVLPRAGFGEEPYEKFLQRLRDNNYFDLALVYLDDAQNSRGLDRKFRSVIDLERALLYFQAASTLSPKSPQRADKLSQTEKFLRKFINDSPEHPRRGEARLKLGGLLRLRAEEALAMAGPNSEQGVPDAVGFFDAANKLYEEAIQELAVIVEALKGARVDPKDTEKVAYRSQVQLDLREAQLYSAKAIEDRGKSRAASDPLRKADLDKALELYNELYKKEKNLAGIRTFALLYRCGVQVIQGQKEDAIDGYQTIVDMENVDQLRPLQTEALSELIKVLASQEKYQPAVERADNWISKLRPDEKEAPEVIALKLAHSKVRADWIKKLKSENEDRLASRVEKAIRSDLRSLIRIPGSHVETAKEIMASLGVETVEAKVSLELPKVKNLVEAIDESQKRIDDADNAAVSLAVLDEQIKDANTPADQKATLTSQRDSQQEQVDELRRSSLELLRIGLQKYDTKKDDRTQLFNARFRMAYLLLKLRDIREAIVVGEFLSRTSPGTPQGLNAASIVLEGFSKLLQNPTADHPSVMAELTPFAEYLVSTWPQSSEATAASGALTQLAVIAKNWDQAEKYLQIMPSTSPGIGRQYFDLGASLFDQYQKMVRDKSTDENTLIAVRDRSAKWLKLAQENIAIDDDTANYALGAANALAQLKLSQNQIDEAGSLMFNGEKAPMNWLESKLDKVSPAAAMDAYRTAMRVTAAQVVDGKIDAATAAKSMQNYVGKLQTLGSKSDEGRQRLQAIFTAIASDLKEKLALVKQADKRAQLSDVVLIVVGEAAKSESYNTQVWAATTLVSMAEGLETQGKTNSVAEPIYDKAAQLLKEMLAKASSQSGWAPEGAVNTLRILRARASEGTSDLRGALEAYAEILDQNGNYLDVQMGVARTLQKAAASNASLYKSAISGARPHAKTKQNVFWGWGKISQEASRKIADYSEQFYEARYQLAQCRMLYALSLPDAGARNKELTSAEKAIIDTNALYPGLGGAEQVQRYDALLKKIQKELGKPETGLGKP